MIGRRKGHCEGVVHDVHAVVSARFVPQDFVIGRGEGHDGEVVRDAYRKRRPGKQIGKERARSVQGNIDLVLECCQKRGNRGGETSKLYAFRYSAETGSAPPFATTESGACM